MGLRERFFGKREQEAYQVGNLIRQLGLNQHGVIGGKELVMEYWLVNGQAPKLPSVTPRTASFRVSTRGASTAVSVLWRSLHAV